jgi:GNAT superfamily N-acetyltransferase
MDYARYLRETLGHEIHEDPEGRGFLTYGFDCIPGVDFPHCYIQEIFVAPEHREKHIAANMADHVAALARACGKHVLFGSVCGTAKNPDRSLKVLMAYGMQLYSIGDNVIYMAKGLK